MPPIISPRVISQSCRCGAQVSWEVPALPLPLTRVKCPACSGELRFSQFYKMDVALSEMCNYHCIMCRRPPQNDFLDAREVQRVMQQGKEAGIQVVSFCGGEPFIHKDFVWIANQAIELGLKVQLATNGSLVTPETMGKLQGLDCFTVSIDAVSETHDAIRGVKGAYQRACQALRLAADARVTCGTNTVIQRLNALQLLDLFHRLLDETQGRINYVRHAPVEIVPQTAQLMVTPEQVPRVQEQLHRIAEECEQLGIYFSHRKQLLQHLELFLDKWTRHRPLGGCRIPCKFIGYSYKGFYLCWHQEQAIRATSLTQALESDIARQVIAAGLQGSCSGCNALTYSWDEEWNEAILAGKQVQDGTLPSQVTQVHGHWETPAEINSSQHLDDRAVAEATSNQQPAHEVFCSGINLPTLLDAYNHDLAPNERFPDWGYEFSPALGFDYLSVCRELGFRSVRIWLCENGEGMRTDKSGRLVGVMPELLVAVEKIQEAACKLGVRLYWTFLDGNAWQRNADALTGAIARDADQARRFAETVAVAVARKLDPKITFALEVFNEPESLSKEVVGSAGISWEQICGSIRSIRRVLHEVLPTVPVTSGTQAVFLPGLWSDKPKFGDAPVDAVDIHVYHPNGGLPSREDLPVDIGSLPLLAGECGTSDRARQADSRYLLHYLYNARKLHYWAAFLWKLEGKEHLGRFTRGNKDVSASFCLTALGEEVKTLLNQHWASMP